LAKKFCLNFIENSKIFYPFKIIHIS